MSRINLGNGYYSSGFRLYKAIWKNNGITTLNLISWQNRQCTECGRYLKKKNCYSRCMNCFRKYYRKYQREYMKVKYFVYLHANELEVGDYID